MRVFNSLSEIEERAEDSGPSLRPEQTPPAGANVGSGTAVAGDASPDEGILDALPAAALAHARLAHVVGALADRHGPRGGHAGLGGLADITRLRKNKAPTVSATASVKGRKEGWTLCHTVIRGSKLLEVCRVKKEHTEGSSQIRVKKEPQREVLRVSGDRRTYNRVGPRGRRR